ncbi:MAG: hypothetical protein GEU26_11705 [Nitrososphaeraceae archaeon]|nr:hypothetical protein [Nitrososphaeraceae archaeon]
MRNRKNRGVSSTKKRRKAVGDKLISISNRSTGTRVQKTKLSPKAAANLKKVKEFMAGKLKFVRPVEFAGKGKSIEILDIDTEANGKFGPCVQIKLKEPESGNERIWNTTSIRALRVVFSLFEGGITRMHVWTRGTGTDTQYYAKELEHQEPRKMEKGRKKNH